jgi:NhaP-type Na+/H+ or K+/H+ antiporter
MDKSTQIIQSKFLDNIQYVINILFFICLAGFIVSWINAEQGNMVGLTIITFSLLFIFLCELSLFNQTDDNQNEIFWGQFMNNGLSLFVIIVGLGWYVSLNASYQDIIQNHELPSTWYDFSSIINGIVFIYIFQLYVYVVHIMENIKVIYKGMDSYLSIFICILLFILISIQYVIINYYRTNG